MLQSPTDFGWAIPKKTASVPAKQTTPTKVTTQKVTTKTTTKAPTTPKVVVQQVILPSNFDASGVLRIRKVNGTDIVEKLIKTRTGSYIGIPYYGL